MSDGGAGTCAARRRAGFVAGVGGARPAGYAGSMATGPPVASRLATLRDDRRWRAIAAGAGAVACVAIALAAATATPARPGLVALGHAVIVGVPIAVGLHAWYTGVNQRFGVLLMAAGGWASLTTLAESSQALPYTVGRAAGWAMEVGLVYLFLAFPVGRLHDRADRLLVAASALVVLTLFAPRLLLAARFEVPSPYTSCVRDCPANALFSLDRQPGAVDALLRPLGVVAVLVVMAAVIVRLQRRLGAATSVARRLHAPVLVVATVRAAVLGVAIAARWVDPQGAGLEAAAWLLALALPLLALAFLAGLVRWRLFAGRALERLAACLRTLPDAATLQRAFAEAFEDPSVQVALAAPAGAGGWVDVRGAPLTLPERGSGRTVSVVSPGARPAAVIVHDAALGDQPEVLRAGLAMAEVALANQRLLREAEVATREVRASRARIAAGAERERRRIERDLHDGAQQRLVALRIELALAEDLVRADPDRAVERLRALEREVDQALEELRALAHGVYPPLLADRGLATALRAAAAQCPLAVDVDARRIGRYPPEVESAVYFCVLEALQNALKHARGATRVAIALDGTVAGELRFAVRDDGAGVPPGGPAAGAGVVNMRDRVAALGGALAVEPAAGGGAVVRGWAPADQR